MGLLGFVFGQSAGAALLAQLGVGSVVAGIVLQRAEIQLPDPVGDGIQESAVVGHHDDRAVPRLQLFFQPLDALDVEVIGRLVEQQQVGPFQQKPGQQCACLFAAAEVRDGLVKLRFVEAQSTEYLRDTRFVGEATGVLEGV